MESFKQRSLEFRLNEPNTYLRNLRGATIGWCEEAYLFLVCAYDYVYNPGDPKLTCILKFLTPVPYSRGQVSFGTSWSINIANSYSEQIKTLLVSPPVMVSAERKKLVPTSPVGNVKISQTTGNAIAPAKLATTGGIKWGGTGNYNLITKAIDIACEGMAQGNIHTNLAHEIVAHRDEQLTSDLKQRLVDRYTTMREFYDDQTLTRFGLTYR